MKLQRIASVIVSTALVAGVVGTSPVTHASTENVVVVWNDAALEAARRSTIGPPAIARALAIVHTRIYDAWAAFDGRTRRAPPFFLFLNSCPLQPLLRNPGGTGLPR